MKLAKALKTIKKECKSHKKNCERCPLYGEKGCLVGSGEPQRWRFKKHEYGYSITVKSEPVYRLSEKGRLLAEKIIKERMTNVRRNK